MLQQEKHLTRELLLLVQVFFCSLSCSGTELIAMINDSQWHGDKHKHFQYEHKSAQQTPGDR